MIWLIQADIPLRMKKKTEEAESHFDTDSCPLSLSYSRHRSSFFAALSI